MSSNTNLGNTPVNQGYVQLIHTGETGGIDGTLRTLYDGDGTASDLQIASNKVKISTELYIGSKTITEYVQDVVGDMFDTNGSHTNITATYDDDGDGAIDLVASGEVTLTGTQTLSNKTLASPIVTGNLVADSIDVAGDLTLDADGADIILKDGGTEYGRLSQVLGGLTLKSGSSGANAVIFSSDGNTAIFAGGVQISGDLIVQGDTTTLNTATLQVEDKNIVMNYHATNDTSGSADGAGITIQDAVNSTTDATMLWDATNDEFDFSHTITAPNFTGNVTGNLTGNVTGNVTGSASLNLLKSNNLSDLTNAATARSNLGVDAAGTDNSTDVTLVTTSHDYLSLSGQAITLGTIDIGDDTNLVGGTGITLTGDTLSTTDSEIVHDNLNGYVENEHKDHSAINITAGSGLSGGGNITASRQLALDISSLDAQTPALTLSDKVAIYDTDVSENNVATLTQLKAIVNTDTNTNQLTTFDVSGDSGTDQTISHGNTLTISGGNGITTSTSATDILSVALGGFSSLTLQSSPDAQDLVVIEEAIGGAIKKVKVDTLTSGISFNGSTANGLLTYGNSTTADVESELTYTAGTLKLERATGNAVFRIQSNDSNPRIYFNEGSTTRANLGYSISNNRFELYADGNTPFSIEDGAGSDTLVVDSNSRVGIGSSSPLGKLHIESGTSTDTALLLKVQYDSSGGDRGKIQWRDGANITGSIHTEFDGTDVSMHFGSLYDAGYNTTSRMVLTGSGLLGIGTTTPTSLLTTSGGDIRILGSGNRLRFNTNGSIYWDSSVGVKLENASTEDITIETNTSGDIFFNTGNTRAMSIQTDNKVFIGDNVQNQSLAFGGTLKTHQYLDTRDYMQHKGHFAESDWIVMESGANHVVTSYFDNTNVYVDGVYKAKIDSAFGQATISSADLSLGSVISADRAVIVHQSGTIRSMCMNERFSGRLLGSGSTRGYPLTIHIYAPYTSVSYSIYRSSSANVDITATALTTGTISQGGIITFTESDTASGTQYYVIEADGKVCAILDDGGQDHLLFTPLSMEVIASTYSRELRGGISDGVDNSTSIQETNNGGGYYLKDTSGKHGLFACGIADGAGSDGEFAMPIEFCSDYYIYGDTELSNFRAVFFQNTFLKVLDASGNVLYTKDASGATKHAPVFYEEGTATGSGTLSTAGPFRFVGTAPFQLVCQEPGGQDETTMLGAMQHELSNNQRFKGGYVPNATTIDANLVVNDSNFTLFADSANNRVGIGTSSPSKKLHIKDSTNEIVVLESSDTHTDIVGMDTGGSSRLRWSQGFFQFYTGGAASSASASGGTFAMEIDENQRVGIGTTSPSNPLHINNSYPQLRLQTTDDNTYTTFGSGTGFMVFNIVNPSNNTYEFRNNGTAQLTIDTSGNVGIGINSPTDTLQVEGSIGVGVGRDAQLTSVNNGLAIRNLVSDADMFFYVNDGGVDTEAMRIDGATANVGIGATSPETPLHVNQDSNDHAFKVTGGGGGASIARFVRDIGLNSPYAEVNIHAGSGDPQITFRDVGNKYFSIGIDDSANAFKISDNSAVGTNDRLTIDTSGDIKIEESLGIGVAASSTTGRLDCSNDVVAFSTSDKRLKENIKPLDSALDKILKISGVEFDWKELTEEEKETIHGNKGHDVGVIAQEIEEVLPEVVTTRDTGYKAVKYEKIVPLLIQAIKEQQQQIEELKNG